MQKIYRIKTSPCARQENMITVAVPLVIYLLFQEKVEGGLAAGAVKE